MLREGERGDSVLKARGATPVRLDHGKVDALDKSSVGTGVIGPNEVLGE